MEAEMARGLLESFGIPSYVISDDAGGAYPFQLSPGGAQLLVTLADQPTVQKLLSALNAKGGSGAQCGRLECQLRG